MTQQQCLFCNIVNGKIDSYKVYEDQNFLAFLDINPATKGHTVLIPKKHMTSIMEMSDEEAAKFFLVSRVLSLVLLEYGAKGVNYLYSMGQAAGQRSPHALMHIIPRYENDGVKLVWDAKKFSQEDFQQQKNQISKLIHDKVPQQTQQQTQPQQMQTQQPRQQRQPSQQPRQPQRSMRQPQRRPTQQSQNQQPIQRQQPSQPSQRNQPSQQNQQYQSPQHFQQPQQFQKQPQNQSQKKKNKKKLYELEPRKGSYWT